MAITIPVHQVAPNKSTATTYTFTATTNPQVGDYVVFIASINVAGNITIGSDSWGGTFTTLASINSNNSSAMFGRSITSVGAGSLSVTLTFTGSLKANVVEYIILRGSGITTTGGAGVGKPSMQSGTVSQTITPQTNSSICIYGVGGIASTANTDNTTGHTALDTGTTSGQSSTTNETQLTGYISVASPSSYTLSWTIPFSESTSLVYHEFYEASGGGADVTPPANVTNLAQTHTSTTANITWTNPADADFNHCNVYRDSTKIGTSTNGSYADSGLTASTVYQYKITSVDTTGNESSGTTISVTTSAPPDTTPPANVTNLAQTHAITTSSLTWTNPSDSDFNHCNVYRGATLLGQSTTGSYSDSGLTASTSYTYKVTSVDNTGNESTGSTINVTTNAPTDTTPPATPTGLVANGGNAQVSLTWNANGESDLSGYNVYRSTDNASFSKINVSLVSTTSYTDSTVTNGTKYYYQITALDTSSNESTKTASVNATPSAPADVTPPANVTNLSATHTSSSASLTWTNPSDSDFNHTNIYRGGTNIGQSTNGTYNDSGLASSTTYTYKVTSVDNSGNESTGVTINVTTDASSGATGIVQNGLIAYFNSKQGVNGTVWSNLAPSTGTMYDATLMNNPVVNPNGMTFSDSTPNYVYFSNPSEIASSSATIEFRTNINNGTSEPDFYDTSTTIDSTGISYGAYPNTDGSTINVSLVGVNYSFANANISGVDNYISIVLDKTAQTLTMYRNGVQLDQKTGVVVASISPNTNASYFFITDSSYPVNGILDNFRIYNRALSASEVSQNFSVGTSVGLVLDTTPPAVPTGLSATGGNAQVILTWNANTDSDLASYSLYKSTDGVAYSIYASSLHGTSFTDNNVTNGTKYWYKLTAVDTSNNESAQSSSTSATPSVPVSYTPYVTSLAENKTKISPISGNNMSVVSILFDHDINGYSININGTDHSSGTIIESGNAQTVAQISANTVGALSGNTVNQLRITPSGTALIIDITNTELIGGQGSYRVNLYGKSNQDGTWTPYNS